MTTDVAYLTVTPCLSNQASGPPTTTSSKHTDCHSEPSATHHVRLAGRDKLALTRGERVRLVLQPFQRLGERKSAEEKVGTLVMLFVLVNHCTETLLPGKRKRRSASTHPLSRSQCRMSASCETSMVSSPPPARCEVTNNRSSASCCRKTMVLCPHLLKRRATPGVCLPFTRSHQT